MENWNIMLEDMEDYDVSVSLRLSYIYAVKCIFIK